MKEHHHLELSISSLLTDVLSIPSYLWNDTIEELKYCKAQGTGNLEKFQSLYSDLLRIAQNSDALIRDSLR